MVVLGKGGEVRLWWSLLTCHTRHTRVTGTGFARVTNCQPAPTPVTARDLNP